MQIHGTKTAFALHSLSLASSRVSLYKISALLLRENHFTFSTALHIPLLHSQAFVSYIHSPSSSLPHRYTGEVEENPTPRGGGDVWSCEICEEF